MEEIHNKKKLQPEQQLEKWGKEMTYQDAEASLLNGIFKKQRLPPRVENSGYQKSHSPPGRSRDAFPGLSV